jgi:glycosyltransferase involved in cell wall biosynthesis
LPIPRVYRRSPFHVISQSTKADIVARGVAEEKVRVIYPGVDFEWLTPDSSIPRDEPPTFLYTGRLQKYKGVEVGIRAVAEANKTRAGARLQIAGAGDDRPRLEKLVASLGLVDLVEFLGYVSEEKKRDLMRRACAVIFPSAKEGWGITNIEAAACGTPAIASNSPGLRETAIHNETGFLVTHGDIAAMADAMVMFGSDPALVSRLGGNARTFSTKFSWDDAASQTETHLLETIDR